MKAIQQAYVGLDLHATRSTFGVIDEAGRRQGLEEMSTDPHRMTRWLEQLPAAHICLALEEGPLSQWMSWQLREVVDELIVCDPKQNFLISRSPRKTDAIDAVKLARLARLGELEPVWHPEGPNPRALFAEAGSHYVHMRRHQVRLKQQIKQLYRRWGVLQVRGEALYDPNERERFLARMDPPPRSPGNCTPITGSSTKPWRPSSRLGKPYSGWARGTRKSPSLPVFPGLAGWGPLV